VQKFIARQPIFDARKVVYGYELLFRASPENFFTAADPEKASANMVDTMFLFGLDRLAGSSKAFINCTHQLIVRDFVSLLPRDQVVVEVLETVCVDDALLDGCRRLKDAGYLIALDDFIDVPAAKPLLNLADIVKLDVLTTSPVEQHRLVRELGHRGIRMLAEKVESYDAFDQAMDMGYMYFQGYFFQRPQVISRHDIPPNKINYLRLLHAVNRPDIKMSTLSDLMKQEASLSYRLLRYLNSAAFALVTEVHSIPHALSLLGENGIRKWVSLVSVAAMADDKPPELIAVPLTRARFCELIAPRAGMGAAANDLFLMGLLSAMDAVLDMRMPEILEEIAVEQDIKDALVGRRNRFRDVFEIVLNYESGVWSEACSTAAELGISETEIPDYYMEAVEWARQILHSTPIPEPT
jgi:c-di-GMP-related signal transduction protein